MRSVCALLPPVTNRIAVLERELVRPGGYKLFEEKMQGGFGSSMFNIAVGQSFQRKPHQSPQTGQNHILHLCGDSGASILDERFIGRDSIY